MQNTIKALVARGLDTETATKLVKAGWTLSKLKQTKPSELKEEGLSSVFIDRILT